MGSFEKLGILVIVVIIVMILAVAIYQWGGAERPDELRTVFDGPTPRMMVNTDSGDASGSGDSSSRSGPREVDYIDRKERERRERELRESQIPDPSPSGDMWPGGIPKTYTIRADDVVWNLVVKTWRLREGFAGAIARANPDVSMKRLRPGQRLRIPNPDAYRSGSKARSGASSRTPRKAPRGTRSVEVQEGDSFSSIAYEQLGKAWRADEIQALNPGVKPKHLKPGQKLLIPAR